MNQLKELRYRKQLLKLEIHQEEVLLKHQVKTITKPSNLAVMALGSFLSNQSNGSKKSGGFLKKAIKALSKELIKNW